jgi:hypothetical protein
VRKDINTTNRRIEKNADRNAQFYRALLIGSTVHYHKSFGQFVRCEVVLGSTSHKKRSHKCLKPIALVGAWPTHDLANWSRYPIYAKCIRTGECIDVHYSVIYESGEPRGRYFNWDPTNFPTLDLSVPAPTKEAKVAKLWTALKEAQVALEAALKAIQGAL